MPSTSNGHRQSTSRRDLGHDSMISLSLSLASSVVCVEINVFAWHDRPTQAYVGVTLDEDARSFLILGEGALINKVFAN